MDQTRLQHQKSLAQSKNNHYQTLKKVTQLLFSLSIFSLFFTRSSWLSLLLHSSDLHLSTFSLLHLFNRAMDKNFMFLLCNGLLVFLANYSGLVRCLSGPRRSYDPFKLYEYGSLSESMAEEREVAVAEERASGFLGPQEERSSSAGEDDRDDDVLEVEEEEEEENNGVLSTEELNRKFDEFIRRMKEEITVDARRTLVVV